MTTERRAWMQPTVVAAKPEGREDAHQKHPAFSLRIEYENGDCPSILYGSLIGSPFYFPSRGIQFIFEAAHPTGWKKWKYARWCVSILGSDLKDIANHLQEGKEVFIRVGGDITEVQIEEIELAVGKGMGQ